MKVLRILAASAALLTIVSCGKEYNTSPSGSNNDADNPLLPLGTAEEGQIRYNLWEDKIRIRDAYWNDTAIGGNSKIRQIVGTLAMPDSTFQTLVIQLPYKDTAKNVLTSKDSVQFALTFTDFSDPAEPIGRVYSNQVPVAGGGTMYLEFSQQDATTLRGNFLGKMSRQFITPDSTDRVEISNGTFFVKKR